MLHCILFPDSQIIKKKIEISLGFNHLVPSPVFPILPLSHHLYWLRFGQERVALEPLLVVFDHQENC